MAELYKIDVRKLAKIESVKTNSKNSMFKKIADKSDRTMSKLLGF